MHGLKGIELVREAIKTMLKRSERLFSESVRSSKDYVLSLVLLETSNPNMTKYDWTVTQYQLFLSAMLSCEVKDINTSMMSI